MLKLDLEGTFILHALDEEQRQYYAENAGYIMPVQIDPANILPSEGTQARISDLISELNYYLGRAHNMPRCAIGEISRTRNGAIESMGYLINNIALRSHGPIDTANNNSFTFDLDLIGNEYLDSTVEINNKCLYYRYN